MPAPKSAYSGMCAECGHWKNDLFRGFCASCRKEYGRQQGKATDKARPRRNKKPPAETFRPKPPAPNLYNPQDRILRILLDDLAQRDYSEDDIERRFETFQAYVEPLDEPILRAIRTLRELSNKGE